MVISFFYDLLLQYKDGTNGSKIKGNLNSFVSYNHPFF